jgi:ATP-dependent RNA helicase DeaD
MNFSELSLLPALAKALATRGYETATGVQAAVLDPALAGRDLLVSSQTGSGKTIAFGAVLARTLLGADDAEEAPAPAAIKARARLEPRALVIVPTRELATQVRAELAWVLAGTRLKLASFTGGTPVSGDLRTLERGVDVVIGTPGRLVDLLRRARLPLGALKVVVLDEADEMLDLGFREDLETILKAAPLERQTLMLSATIPPEIKAMARRFQRDAVPIDPRKTEGGTTKIEAHEDITYVAHMVSGGDRLAVVVNVLRASDSPRAIVFCTTREGVAGLHAALVARGFTATAISGERAQAERDRALDQLRRGEVRILVATNVAARGLHLPDVDLIVHADLPLNAESLTHRSGRTGRAGRKGTAVVLATSFERRKAERLMATAHVKAVWTPPPSREAIAAAARERLALELLAPAEGEPAAFDKDAAALAQRLETDVAAPALIQRLLARELARLPSGEKVQAVGAPRPEPDRSFRGGRDERDERFEAPRNRSELSRQAVLFRVNLGAQDNADPRWLLPLICRRGGVTRRDVGAIRVGPRETTFEISGEAALEFADAAAESDPRAPHVFVERADEPAREPTRESAQESAPKRREGPAPRPHAQPPQSRDELPPRAPEQAAKEQPAKEHPAKELLAKEHPAKELLAKEQSAKERPAKERPPKSQDVLAAVAPEKPAKEHPAKPRQELASHAPGQPAKSREGFAPLRPRTAKPGSRFASDRTEEPARRRDGLTPYKPARDKRPVDFQPQLNADVKPQAHARPGAEIKPEPHGKAQTYDQAETHDKPAYDKPAYDKPARGKPAYGKPAYGKPAFGKPAYGKPAFGKPAFGKPAFGKPAYGKPAYGKPAYGKPAYGKPAYGKPTQGKPTFGKPTFGKPAFGKPAFGKPAHGKPTFGKPTFGKPGRDRPDAPSARPTHAGPKDKPRKA